jgi:hypothetical protein
MVPRNHNQRFDISRRTDSLDNKVSAYGSRLLSVRCICGRVGDSVSSLASAVSSLLVSVADADLHCCQDFSNTADDVRECSTVEESRSEKNSVSS